MIDKQAITARIQNTVVRHAWYERAFTILERVLDGAMSGGDPRSVAVIGESGAGKSRLLQVFEAKHPRERRSNGLYIPVLRATVPSKPTESSFLTELLTKQGDPLPNKDTVAVRKDRFIEYVEKTGTKLLVLDEFQHLVDQATERVQFAVTDWLKVLVEETRLNLAVSGLERSMRVFETNSQLKRRFRAPLVLPRFDWREPDLRDQFRLILAQMQKTLDPITVPDLSSEEMAFRCFCATGGLLGRLKNLLIEIIQNAVDTGRHNVTPDDMDMAANEASYDIPMLIRSPFCREISILPTEEVIASALSLTADEEIPKAQKPKVRRRSKAGNILTRKPRKTTTF